MDEKKFIDLYQRYKESQLSVAAFCANEIIAPSTFYYWKKRLRAKRMLPDFIPIIIDKTDSFNSHQIPVHKERRSNPDQTGESSIEVEFPNGTIIRLKNHSDFSFIKEIFQLYR